MLKGQCHEIFAAIFFIIILSQSPENNIFEKNREALIGYSGAWGKLIHEKTLCRKSRETVPINKRLLLPEVVVQLEASGAKSNSCKRRHFDLRQMLKVVYRIELAADKSTAGFVITGFNRGSMYKM